MSAGDSMIKAIAEEVVLQLERIQTARRRLLTVEDAAEYLGISDDTLQRLVAEQRIVPCRFDRRPRFDVRDLDRLIDESKTGRPST